MQQEQDEEKNKQIYKAVNQPSSKKPEWDKDGHLINKKKKKNQSTKKKRTKRPGCGNARKTDIKPDEVNHVPLDSCPDCGMNLRDRKGADKPGRLVEDIDPPQEKTTVSKELEQMK